MKKKLMLLLVSIMTITLLIGCSASSSDNAESNSEDASNVAEKQESQLYLIHTHLIDMNDKSMYIVSQISENWDADAQNKMWKALFDKSVTLQNSDWKAIQEKVFDYRNDVQAYQTSIREDLKNIDVVDELADYKQALSDMYIEINAFADIACNYPSGYSKFTYLQFISDYKSEYEKLKSTAELLK